MVWDGPLSVFRQVALPNFYANSAVYTSGGTSIWTDIWQRHVSRRVSDVGQNAAGPNALYADGHAVGVIQTAELEEPDVAIPWQ